MNGLWRRQLAAVVRLELSRNLFALRAFPLYLLAALPIFVIAMLLIAHSLDPRGVRELTTPAGVGQIYAHIFQFMLRFVIYGGCVWTFMNLFRGEILDRSLHYYFLAPVRRELLVLGKFLSGWITVTTLFVGVTIMTLVLIHLPLGPGRGVSHLLAGPGFSQLAGYVSVTALAGVGYGAVFLVVGLFFRNPIVPALVIWAWEWINAFLPALLKKISVIFYLESMLPVRIQEGPFAFVADPAPAWLAVPGLIAFSLVTMGIAGLRIRRQEISYAD